jgi:hypothetical protein
VKHVRNDAGQVLSSPAGRLDRAPIRKREAGRLEMGKEVGASETPTGSDLHTFVPAPAVIQLTVRRFS